MNRNVLTVSSLNYYIKSKFDEDENLKSVFVEGEISNFKNHYQSGHLYFSLKDENSIISCVMFNRAASRLKFNPENDMKVIISGKVAVYDRDGRYQIYCEDMQPIGAGALSVIYEQLKRKLTAEGLFDIKTKRPLPQKIKRIAVLTSKTGAAIHDIISVAERRNPFVKLVICPVTVQGDNASQSIINMLNTVYETDGIDLIILGRGGGSFEDLFCFNDEDLVRKVYESPVPLISAVGHETDYTLCDFAADLRAATPSAAAELAVPLPQFNRKDLDALVINLKSLIYDKLNLSYERLDRCTDSVIFKNPQLIINEYLGKYKFIMQKFSSIGNSAISKAESNNLKLFSKLEELNPLTIMSRGYSTVYSQGKIVSDAGQINIGENIDIRFGHGTAKCKVLNKNNG